MTAGGDSIECFCCACTVTDCNDVPSHKARHLHGIARFRFNTIAGLA